MLTACSTSASDAEPTPTPLPTPVVPEKPTYVVQRGAVTKSLEFTGRVAPVEQQDLFFRDRWLRAQRQRAAQRSGEGR